VSTLEEESAADVILSVAKDLLLFIRFAQPDRWAYSSLLLFR